MLYAIYYMLNIFQRNFLEPEAEMPSQGQAARGPKLKVSLQRLRVEGLGFGVLGFRALV